MTLKNQVGMVYGRMTVVRVLPRTAHNTRVVAKCECGTEKEVILGSLRSGKTTSCGCAQKEASTTHGQSRNGNRLYRVWASMKARCADAANLKYGGRGITVCADWNIFKSFQKWAESSGYQPGLSLDRKHNDKGYSPENCHWTTPTMQSRNRRSASGASSNFVGVYFCTTRQKWVAQITVDKRKKTLGLFDSDLAAAQAREAYILTNNLTGFTLNNVIP